jgi:hypothetical protein
VATRIRSAGSRCGSGSSWAISMISWVRGASRRGAMTAVSHSDKLAGTRKNHDKPTGQVSTSSQITPEMYFRHWF